MANIKTQWYLDYSVYIQKSGSVYFTLKYQYIKLIENESFANI